MINTKTNSTSTILFLLLITIGFYACSNKEAFVFEKQNFTSDTISDCVPSECALVEVHSINALGDTPVISLINKEIENFICDALHIEGDSPESSIEEAIHEFNASYQAIRDKFPSENVPYEATIDCELSLSHNALISIAIDSYLFTGGAHGNATVTYLNINPENGKKLSNKELFKEYKQFEHYAEKMFRNHHDIPNDQSINSTGFMFENDVFSLPSAIGFTDTEVILYYNQYEISSYAEGPIELKLNKDEVASYLAFSVLD